MLLTRVLVASVTLAALVGCTDDGPDDSDRPADRPSVVAGSGAVGPCTPMPWGNNVLQGRSDDGQSVVALLQAGPGDLAGPQTVRVGRSVKLVVRITGAGGLDVAVTGPGEVAADLDWGPETHADSNFDHPGEEWGIGFTLDRPGCWTVAFTRSEEGTGYVQLEVA